MIFDVFCPIQKNIHRKDLPMIEKGRVIHAIFEEHGIDTPAKKLTTKLNTISKKEKGNYSYPDFFPYFYSVGVKFLL